MNHATSRTAGVNSKLFLFNPGEPAMIHEGCDLMGKPLYAIDQKLGTVADFYFDDLSWKIRYFQIDPHNPANPGDVLVSPDSLAGFAGERLSIQLTEREIFNCMHNNQTTGSNDGWNHTALPMVLHVNGLGAYGISGKHFRSFLSVLKYPVYTNEAHTAKIKGILFDEPSWLLRAFVFAFRDQTDPLSRLIDPVFINSIDPALEEIHLGCSGVFLRQSPVFDREKYTGISFSDFLQRYSQAIGR